MRMPVADIEQAAKSIRLPRLKATKVAENLFRGRAATTQIEFDRIVQGNGIKRVISLLDPTNAKERSLIALERKLAAKNGLEIHFLAMPLGKRPPKASLDKFFKLTSDGVPTYLHCKRGKDRTGAIIAAFQIKKQGLAPNKALEVMRSFGFNPVGDPHLRYLREYVLNFPKSLVG